MRHHRSFLECFDAAVEAWAPSAIAARAHELWVSCGEPVVQDDAVWQEAERELMWERNRQRAPVHSERLSA